MSDADTTTKLIQAFRLLTECGCTIEHQHTADSLLRVSMPNFINLSVIDTICNTVAIEPPTGIGKGTTILTPQQTEVLLRIRAAKPNKQIAYELGITETTVKAHATNIYRRLGVRNRAEAVLFIQRQRRDQFAFRG